MPHGCWRFCVKTGMSSCDCARGRSCTTIHGHISAAATHRADIAKLHEFEHWPARWIWPMFIAMLALGLPQRQLGGRFMLAVLALILPVQSH